LSTEGQRGASLAHDAARRWATRDARGFELAYPVVQIGAARHLLAGLEVPASVEAFNAGDDAIAADFEASTQQGLEP